MASNKKTPNKPANNPAATSGAVGVQPEDAMAIAQALTSAANAIAGIAHARTAANTESQISGRTTKDADRSETVSGSTWRRDSDTNVEEGFAGHNLESARRNRLHFDAMMHDARIHANASAERVGAQRDEANKYFSGLGTQQLDSSKIGSNAMWTQSNELEIIANAVEAKILARMGSSK